MPTKDVRTTQSRTGKPVRRRNPNNSIQATPANSTTDLASLAGAIPAEILQQMVTAIRSGRWLFSVWHLADGQIHLERTATNFPTADLEPAVALLSENLQQRK